MKNEELLRHYSDKYSNVASCSSEELVIALIYFFLSETVSSKDMDTLLERLRYRAGTAQERGEYFLEDCYRNEIRFLEGYAS